MDCYWFLAFSPHPLRSSECDFTSPLSCIDCHFWDGESLHHPWQKCLTTSRLNHSQNMVSQICGARCDMIWGSLVVPTNLGRRLCLVVSGGANLCPTAYLAEIWHFNIICWRAVWPGNQGIPRKFEEKTFGFLPHLLHCEGSVPQHPCNMRQVGLKYISAEKNNQTPSPAWQWGKTSPCYYIEE